MWPWKGIREITSVLHVESICVRMGVALIPAILWARKNIRFALHTFCENWDDGILYDYRAFFRTRKWVILRQKKNPPELNNNLRPRVLLLLLMGEATNC